MNIKALLQRIPVDSRIREITKNYREAIGVPLGGFDSYEDWESWSVKVANKKRGLNFNQYFREIKKIVPYKGVVSNNAFKGVILDFYYIKNFDVEDQYQKYRFDLFGVGLILNKKTDGLNLTKGKGLEDGVYIRIPSNIDPSELKKFVTEKKEVIRSVQMFFNENKKIASPKLTYLSGLERDEIISALYDYSLKELEEMTGLPREGLNRDDYTALVVEKYLGFSPTSGAAVLQAKKRFRRKEKGLWGDY